MSDTPEHFLCPISMVVMSHPIRTETGHVFERRAIMAWMYFGKGNCPMSRKPLHPSGFVRDVQLENEIKEWRRTHSLPASEDDEHNDDDELDTQDPAKEGLILRQLLAPASGLAPESDKMTELLQLRNKILLNRDRRLAHFQQSSRL